MYMNVSKSVYLLVMKTCHHIFLSLKRCKRLTLALPVNHQSSVVLPGQFVVKSSESAYVVQHHTQYKCLVLGYNVIWI